MTAADLVTYLALLAGCICLALYVWEAWAAISAKPASPDIASSDQLKSLVADNPATVKDLSDLAANLAKLTDSLAKAGPALTSLIGSVLFFAIAAIGSGALHGSPAPAPTPTPTPAPTSSPAPSASASPRPAPSATTTASDGK